MTVAEDADLSPVLARLSQAAPAEWKEFKAAFRKYADKKRDALVRASLDELQKSQGRAQECAHLIALHDDAVTAADRIRMRPQR